MADLSITASNVGVGGVGTLTELVQVGEAVTPGQVAYRDPATSKALLADADSASKDAAYAIVISSAALDGWAIVASQGPVNLGAILTVGKVYVLSDTPGGIKPVEDLVAGDKVTILGVATSTSTLELKINVSGAEVPA